LGFGRDKKHSWRTVDTRVLLKPVLGCALMLASWCRAPSRFYTCCKCVLKRWVAVISCWWVA
jgi:hypothetical protein